MVDLPHKRTTLSWVYYHKIELLSAFFSILIFLLAFFLIRDVSQNRRAGEQLARQAAQQKKILEDQIKFNKFLIDNNGQTIGELRQEIIDQAARDRGELRRLEDALRAAGVRLPAQSVLEGSAPVLGASLSSTATPAPSPSGTVVTAPQPTGQMTRGHSFPNICLIGICLFGDI
jgi:hypothetical protein